MQKSVLLAALVALVGCEEEKFPGHVGDRHYKNGHPIATNAVEEEALEADLYNRINALRHANGKGPLRWNDALAALGRANSIHQHLHDFTGYVNPEGEDLRDRVIRIADDVAWQALEAVFIISDWVTMEQIMEIFAASEGYSRVLLGKSNLVGIGIVRRPFMGDTCLFITIELVDLL